MDTKINIKEFSKYAKEVCLQNFLLAHNIMQDLKSKGDLAGYEKIENQVIPAYENIYLSLDEKELEEIYKENQETFEKIKKTIDDLARESNFTDDFIKSQIEKRELLKGKSGAEVMERFFKYKIKELKKAKGDVIYKLNKLLDEEEKLNLELANAIQEVEQLEIVDKINPVRRKYREQATILDKYQAELSEAENKLTKKWYYEIYGTVDEKVLLDIYNNVK